MGFVVYFGTRPAVVLKLPRCSCPELMYTNPGSREIDGLSQLSWPRMVFHSCDPAEIDGKSQASAAVTAWTNPTVAVAPRRGSRSTIVLRFILMVVRELEWRRLL